MLIRTLDFEQARIIAAVVGSLIVGSATTGMPTPIIPFRRPVIYIGPACASFGRRTFRRELNVSVRFWRTFFVGYRFHRRFGTVSRWRSSVEAWHSARAPR